MPNENIHVQLNNTNSVIDSFHIRKKDETFLRKILIMMEKDSIQCK